MSARSDKIVMGRNYLCACFVIALIASVVMTGCAGKFPPYRLQYTESTIPDGREFVTLKNFSSDNKPEVRRFKLNPKRIIAVGEAAAETLLRLGQAENLVAIVDTVESGAELKARFPEFNRNGKCKILNRPGLETLMLLQPDFLVGWASNFTMKRYGSTAFWEERGASVYLAPSSMPIYPEKTVDMEMQYISDLGRIVGCAEFADQIADGIRNEIAECAKKIGGRRPRVMVLALSRSLIINYNKGTLPGNIVELSGGRMLSSDRYLSPEELISINPDVIFIVRLDRRLDVGVKALVSNPKFRTLDCIATGNVYGIPVHWVYNSGINAGNAVKTMARYLHRYGEAYTAPRF